MEKLYNPKISMNTILFVESSNIYGWAVSQYLPTGGYEWVKVSENEDWTEFILKQGDEQEEGYFLEVDLENFMISMTHTHVHQKKIREKKGISVITRRS